ncbi:hypothetical protein D9619_005364 [Psilocybe cf. subviscida]|uniref:Fungal-type protein kinase domain-containing protein n=1 Tax=Psilocybe cf. subviscida TaxID=2480587 RepID=A0A8H5BWE6_9AGAR|nr:hypothetical protein D9619_005364 [Psilocybe cf. subviscida]
MDGNLFSAISHVSSDIQGPVDIELKGLLSAQSHRLSGRMTTVLKASAVRKDSDGERVRLACKISRPEVQRISEGDVLSTAQAIALDREPKMRNHLPKLYFSGDLRAGNTLHVRSLLNLNGKGHRTLRVLVINELEPLTAVTGKSFVKGWLDVVTCHVFLWKHGVEHGDPSLANMMYDPIEGCGVLSDFDWSNMAWLERVPGNNRTGTIPFMAIDLLSDAYWKGYRERCHHHELEAFIWILSVVFLAYENRICDPENILTKDWFTSDYIACAEEKAYFLSQNLQAIWSLPFDNFEQYQELLYDACLLVHKQFALRNEDRGRRAMEDHKRRAVEARGRHALEDCDRAEGDSTNKINKKEVESIQDDTQAFRIQYSEATWDQFISILSKFSSQPNIELDHLDINSLETHKPTFDISQCQLLFAEMRMIYGRVTNKSQPGRVSDTVMDWSLRQHRSLRQTYIAHQFLGHSG